VLSLLAKTMAKFFLHEYTYTFGSYKGEVAPSHPLFSVRKQYFFTLKTLLAPLNAPFDDEIGLHRP
jgi:hypothetical protein